MNDKTQMAQCRQSELVAACSKLRSVEEIQVPGSLSHHPVASAQTTAQGLPEAEAQYEP